MNEIVEFVQNNSTSVLISMAVIAVLLPIYFLWPFVIYDPREGQLFWFDRIIQHLAWFGYRHQKKVKVLFFILAIVAVVFYWIGAYDSAQSRGHDNQWIGWAIIIGIISLISCIIFLLFVFWIHSDKVKFTLPTLRVVGISSFVGIIYGGYAICHRPDVPDGVLSGLLWKALRVDIKDSDIQWLKSVDFTDAGVYARSLFSGDAFWVVAFILLAVVLYELFLRHGWIYSIPCIRCFTYPVVCTISAAFFAVLSFVVGFVGFGYAFVTVCYVISIIVAIFVGYLALWLLASGAPVLFQSSSGGGGSGSGDSSYSSSSSSSDVSSSSNEFTMVDGQGREYHGSGDTMYRDTPGDNGTFDRHNDGTWTSRYGDEVLREKGPGD